MRYYRYILGTLGTFEVSLVHRWYINVSSLYRFQAQKRYVIYSFIHVPILYQIGHISDIFGNPVQNRYTFFVPVKMYQFCTFFRCGHIWIMTIYPILEGDLYPKTVSVSMFLTAFNCT